MITSGYIFLWRKITETSFYKNPNCAHLAIYLLMQAKWTPNDEKILISGHEQIIKRGQLWVGRKKMSMNTGLSEQSVRTCLRLLTTTGFLTSEPTNNGTLITICKYDDYQNLNHQPTTESTSDQPAINQRSTSDQPHLKKDKKEIIEEDKNKEALFDIPEALNTPKFIQAWGSWQAHRKEIHKPLTRQSVKMQMKTFADWGVDRAVAAIEHTISKGWQGIREEVKPVAAGGNPALFPGQALKLLEELRTQRKMMWNRFEVNGTIPQDQPKAKADHAALCRKIRELEQTLRR
jgi:predicted transcriptional regulator